MLFVGASSAVLNDECTLFVSNYPPETTDDDLTEIFKPFGLLHSVRMFAPETTAGIGVVEIKRVEVKPEVQVDTTATDSCDAVTGTSIPEYDGDEKVEHPPLVADQTQKWRTTTFTVVTYYSNLHARNALKATNRKQFKGSLLKVKLANKRVQADGTVKEFDLNIDKCFELANSFIGYNKWCSNIKEIERIELVKRANNKYLARFACTVRHTLREDGRFVEGKGEGEHEEDTQGGALDFAKKKAVTDARKQAFKKMFIIMLQSGKTVLHLEGAPPILVPTDEMSTSTATTASTSSSTSASDSHSDPNGNPDYQYFHIDKKRKLY